mmetsp:Transcript_27155/g.71456  ORF Transcript_27155/g.71456 Transcript_27155/m.71456 type:complete len:293 (-) Transcript_27155:2774-3652(-)
MSWTTISSNSGAMRPRQTRQCKRRSKKRLVNEPCISVQTELNSTYMPWETISIWAKPHMTFVRMRPRLQQSVTKKTTGVWYTDCAFVGSMSLSSMVPKPMGMTAKTATAIPTKERTHNTMCTKRPRMLPNLVQMAGRASQNLTLAKTAAENATTPRLRAAKSEILPGPVTFVANNCLTSTRPSVRGRTSTVTTALQASATSTADTASTCQKASRGAGDVSVPVVPELSGSASPESSVCCSASSPLSADAACAADAEASGARKCRRPTERNDNRRPFATRRVRPGDASRTLKH